MQDVGSEYIAKCKVALLMVLVSLCKKCLAASTAVLD